MVTGGGRGIGRAIALALGEAGAAVAVCARSQAEITGVAAEIADRNGRAVAVRCDVRHRSEVEDMAARVEAALGPVDLLVNNAGQFGPVGPIAAADPDQWWQTLEVNLRGPLYCTRAVLPRMLARGHGRIVNVYCRRLLGRADVVGLRREQGRVVPAQWFADAFASQEAVSADPAAALVVRLASGAADALSGRYICAAEDVAQMASRAEEIDQHDLYVLRQRERCRERAAGRGEQL